MKRLPYILIILAVLALAALLAFFLLRETPASPPAPNGGAGGLPEVPEGSQPAGTTFPLGGETPLSSGEAGSPSLPRATITPLAEEAVMGFFADATGTITLVQRDGQIISIDPSGQRTVLNGAPIVNLAAASFSSDGKKLIV